MAGFVQIIEWSSSRWEDVKALSESRSAEMADEGGPVRLTVTANRDVPTRYMTIVEFESYEVAMANSADPRTDAFAQKMAELCDGPPTFYNLDVVEQVR